MTRGQHATEATVGSTATDRRTDGGSRRTPWLLLAGVKDPIKDFINEFFVAMFDLILSLFTDIIEAFLYLDPATLKKFEAAYQLGMVVFFSLIAIYGVALLGMFQQFPSTEKTDPLRFGKRAVAAATSLWIVNPPGWGPTLLGQGAFAAAFRLTNVLSRFYLDQVGTSLTLQSDKLGNALSGPFLLLAFGSTIGGSILVAELVVLGLLLVRQVVIYFIYALYPVLICFWLVDSGPLKYGQQLASRLFKTGTTLLVGGVLIAAIFTVGLGLISGSSTIFAGGTTAGTTTGPPVSGGVFASGGGGAFILNFLLKAIIVIVLLVVPALLLLQMLGPVGSAVSGVAQVGAAVLTSGASSAASLATQGGKLAAKEISKKGVKKGTKAAVKKGTKQGAKKASEGLKDRAKQSIGQVANDQAPTPGSGGGGGPGQTLANRAPGMSDVAATPPEQAQDDEAESRSQQQDR